LRCPFIFALCLQSSKKREALPILGRDCTCTCNF
jgi:hypothetical protein